MDTRWGGSVQVTTQGDNRVLSILEAAVNNLNNGASATVLGSVPLQGQSCEAEEVTVWADGGNASSKTLKVGPNGSANNKLAANQGVWWQKCDPSLICYNDGGNSGLIFYVSWGGPTDRWVEQQRAKRAAGRS